MLFGLEWDLTNNWAFAWSILPMLLRGMVVTLQATALGMVIALVLGLVLALLKMVPNKLISWPVSFFLEFVRNTPLLVQLYFLYFVLPDFGILLPAFLTGAVALGVQYSAYTAEVYRAGLQAVEHGQHEAATALNLPGWLAFRDIVIPQAIPRIIPALGNYLISMLKDTPLLSVVTILEMMGVANVIAARTFNYMVPLTMVGGLFLLLSLVSAWLVRLLERLMPKAGVPLR